jgi:hypothetical protein
MGPRRPCSRAPATTTYPLDLIQHANRPDPRVLSDHVTPKVGAARGKRNPVAIAVVASGDELLPRTRGHLHYRVRVALEEPKDPEPCAADGSYKLPLAVRSSESEQRAFHEFEIGDGRTEGGLLSQS